MVIKISGIILFKLSMGNQLLGTLNLIKSRNLKIRPDSESQCRVFMSSKITRSIQPWKNSILSCESIILWKTKADCLT